MPAPCIHKLDTTDPAVRAGIVAHLQPVEPYALFILGNLLSDAPGSHHYLAQSDDQWLGIAAYFDRFKSMTVYAQDPHATRALTAHIAHTHRHVDYMNAIASVGAVACEELRRLGYQPANDPRQVLMEAPMPNPPPAHPNEPPTRLARPGEEYALADLARHLSRPEDPSPPTPQEVARQSLTHRFVIEADGRLAATATTNGMAIRCFQLLGVVTHPDYRRRGYATALCAALMRHMHTQGARHAVLFTGIENTSAQKCYQRLGFHITSDYLMAKFTPPEPA